jgi:amino acid adenylation domain-containing protein
MTSASASSETGFGKLSADRAQLLKRLLEKRVEDTQRIRRMRRDGSTDGVRVPASWTQQRLWFIDQLQADTRAYHIAVALRLRGSLDQRALKQALDELVQRHEVLRTTFEAVNGQPMQQVAASGSFVLVLTDLSRLEASDSEAQVRAHRTEEVNGRFDLRTGPLIRGRLLRIRGDEHVLLITMHHIISDGWSLGVLYRELGLLYNVCRGNGSAHLDPLDIQYADYVEWQRQQFHSGAFSGQLAYWRERLEGIAPQLDLPADRPRPLMQSFRGSSVRVVLDAQLRDDLTAVAQRHDLTLFMVLYAAWAALLFRLSGQHDVAIGTPIANRQRPELEGLVGFFANTLVLRADIHGDMSVEELLACAKDTTLGAYNHQDAAFEHVVDAVQPQRSLNRNPLFQVALVLQNTRSEAPDMTGLMVTPEDELEESAMFDLTLSLEERGRQIVGTLNYASDLFDRGTIERWVASLQVLLRGMAANPRSRVAELPVLSETERQVILESFNATQRDCRGDRLVHDLFQEQAGRTPGAIAAVCESESLTYQQVNERANRLAHFLQHVGVQSGEYVPVLMPRSGAALIAQLAVLKAGCAYMPLDPALPAERQAFMIRDCGARLLLASQPAPEGLAGSAIEWIDCSRARVEIERFSATNLQLQSRPAAAYLMYTSGSTGVPKGVVIPHAAISRLAINNGYAQIESTDRIAHCSNLAFDASTFEIWGAWLNGARLVVVPQATLLDADRFAALLKEQRVSMMFLTIGLFSQYVGALADVFPQMRCVMTGGDVVELATARRVLRGGGPGMLLNAYGPTECTTFATTYRIESVGADASSIPIGRPISNTRIYILDGYLRAVPIGVVGEIYIGGEGVALGYLNRPQLTAERFVKDPFSEDERGRMYRTGDLGRWRADGNIEFLGRNDHQVKIRGFRIELGEIEARILDQPQVREAAVIAREDQPGGKRLVAYVVWQEGADASVEWLRGQLKAVLPEHMVPSAFVRMPSLPLTPNGKLDRRALPAPELGAYASREYQAAQGEVEEALAGIWQELLRVERVGRQDNFFELGGHSLLIVQMMERLRRVGLTTNVRSIYESANLADLAAVLREQQQGSEPEVPANLIPAHCERITPQMLPLIELQPQHIERIVQAVPGGARNVQDIYPLAPLQEGMLFHHLLNEQGGDTYARSLLLELESRERLDDLITGLQALIDRHDVLRTAILWEQLPQAVQVVQRKAALPVREVAGEAQLRQTMQSAHRRFDLGSAPLVRLEVARAATRGHWYALLQTHHLVFDNESLQAIFAEIVIFRRGAASQVRSPAAHRNYVARALAYARKDDAETFFRGKLGSIEEPTAPFGLLDVHGDGSGSEQICVDLDAELAQQLRGEARRRAVSTATLFHAAWALVVAQASARDDVVFGSVLLGRMHGDSAFQGALGMFMNTLPLRLQLDGITAVELVERTQRELLELLHHQQASLAVAQRCSGIDDSRPLFSALINYVHGSIENPDVTAAHGVRLVASRGGTNYPLMLTVHDDGGAFTLKLDCDSRADGRRIVGHVCAALQSLAGALAQAPNTPALALTAMTGGERRQVIELFNATRARYPHDALIHEVFESQVRRTPDATAVIYAGRSLTFGELNTKANQLAHYLRRCGAGPDRLIGLCVERSLDMVVGMLGILKTGAAYLPLDPDYPPERLQHMLADAAPSALLTQASLRERLPTTAVQVIALDDDRHGIGACPVHDLDSATTGVRSENLAYVIYTSGSTGQPKGVMVEHRNVLSLWQGLEQIYRQHPTCKRIGVNASFTFDASVKQLVQLLSGRTLVVVPQEHRWDAVQLLALLHEQRIDGIDCTPWQLKSWLSAGLLEPTRHRPSVVLVGGEPIDPQLWNRLAGQSDIDFYNVYGPTESTVDTTFARLRGATSAPHIGVPMENRRVYILDRHRRPLPIGVAGEIYIGGAGVARGYLNRPDLTAQRFVADPFSDDPRDRLYQCGDLARWHADGTIEYIGRNDQQVKIRGFRVELGEIEAQLRGHAQVSEAVVVACEGAVGEPRLVAYVVAPDGCAAPLPESLRTHLQGLLPEYMVPSAFVTLDRLPLTPNGKLDRRALPLPDRAAVVYAAHEAPCGPVEEALAEIWQELLGQERVGRRDNFFELGGHSLLAMTVVVRVAARLGVKLPVIAVFQQPTIRSMAEMIESRRGTPIAAIQHQGEELETGTL